MPGDDMREIPLTQGKVAIVDDEDFEELSKYKWHASRGRHTFYAIRTLGKHPHMQTIHMHREILKPPLLLLCDHINHDGLDNRRCNLRICTYSQNLWNQRLQGGTSVYKGVYFDKRRNKWQAYITPKPKGERQHLGRFAKEIDAALAYDNAAAKFFGEFARLNFPEEGINANAT